MSELPPHGADRVLWTIEKEIDKVRGDYAATVRDLEKLQQDEGNLKTAIILAEQRRMALAKRVRQLENAKGAMEDT